MSTSVGTEKRLSSVSQLAMKYCHADLRSSNTSSASLFEPSRPPLPELREECLEKGKYRTAAFLFYKDFRLLVGACNLLQRALPRYDCLKAHLTVSLEENRGGADAAAFGATAKKAGGDRPWGAAGGPKTIADVVAAAAAAAGSSSSGEIPSSDEGAGEGQYLWGCTSPQEEREQLVSFASLGCFDPSARLQVWV